MKYFVNYLFDVIYWKKYDLSHNVKILQDKNEQRLPKLDSDQDLPKNTTRSLPTSYRALVRIYSFLLFYFSTRGKMVDKVDLETSCCNVKLRLANSDIWTYFSYFSTFLLGSKVLEKVYLESSK